MKPKSFALLSIAAAVAVVGAAIVHQSENSWTPEKFAGVALLPNLSKDAEALTSIEVKQGDTVLTFNKKGDDWTIKERDGWKANEEPLRAMLVGLSQAKLMEEKTRDPKRYHILSLEDPSSKEAKSKSVRLLSADSVDLGHVIIGTKRWNAFGSGRGGTYVRKVGEASTWLADTDINVPTNVTDWVSRDIEFLEPKSIKLVSFKPEGEESIDLQRASEENIVLELVDKTLADQLRSDMFLTTFAPELKKITPEDVRKRVSTSKAVNQTEIELKDSVKIILRYFKDDSDHWLSIDVEGDGETADKIRERLAGWDYKIPQWRANALFKTRSDLFKTS